MTTSAVIYGCAGTALGDDEARFFADAAPAGFILFGRNCRNPDQVRALCAALREAVGRDDAPILIDQEGGRVQRLGPPQWPPRPPARVFGDLARRDGLDAGIEAARLNARLMAADLRVLGITVDCAPVLDVPVAGAHEIIGDRAFGTDPETVAALGRAVCEGLLAGGVLPVVKHIPGHGRAAADSHMELPVVAASRDEMRRTDFAPFAALNDQECAMAAHVLYTDLDDSAPATASARVIGEVIRGEIGFDGLLLSDDIGMEALSGKSGERCAAMLAAGCDIALECSGDLSIMRETATGASPLTDEATSRLDRAIGEIRPPGPFDAAAAAARLAALTDGVPA